MAEQSRSAPGSRNQSVSEQTDDAHKTSHHNDTTNNTNTKPEPVSRQSTAGDANSQPVIKGPLRLLRLLPRETRHIIGRMLELDPNKRADMDEILADPWVQNSLVCKQEEEGIIVRAPNHTHALQPSNVANGPAK